MKALAVIVLAVAAIILLHAIVGIVGAIIKIAIIIGAIFAVLWAWRTLRGDSSPA